MKRLVKILLLVLVILTVLYGVLSSLGVIRLYRIPTTGNEPGIETGSTIFITNLIDYERFDFIAFRKEEQGKNYIYVNRLCALEGETVEFKKGVCYVNGQNQETGLTLNHTYTTIADSALKIIGHSNLREGIDYIEDPFFHTFSFFVTAEFAKKNPALIRDTVSYLAPEIHQAWDQPWSSQNFGPVTVPADHCFVIGDNRDNSRDSRYFGPIPLTDIVGVRFD